MREGGCAVFRGYTSISDPRGGRVQGLRSAAAQHPRCKDSPADLHRHAHRRPRTHTHAPAPKPSLRFAAGAAKKIRIFCHSFSTVATVAKALQLTGREQLYVTAMWDNMVNIRRLHTETVTGTDPAEGLAGQLSASPPFPAISRVRVQVMPRC